MDNILNRFGFDILIILKACPDRGWTEQLEWNKER